MGITGVNFAAAASGHLVMLENEGNLRLSAWAPPVHVALMGLEKIIPSLARPGGLPAAAAGQRHRSASDRLRQFYPGLETPIPGNPGFLSDHLGQWPPPFGCRPHISRSLVSACVAGPV